MYCPKCNEYNVDNATFCSNCGEKLQGQTSTQNYSQQNYNQHGYNQQGESQVKNFNLITAWVHCIKNYVNFSGRARRSEFWFFTLFNIIVNTVIGVITPDTSVSFSDIPDFTSVESIQTFIDSYQVTASSGISNLYSLFIFIPSIAVAFRRLHDVSKSGALIFVPYVCYAIIIIGVISLFFAPGFGVITIIVGGLLSFASSIWLLVLYCMDTHRKENKYGLPTK
ncbi:hypothetical protein FACS1894132_09960 [Clostridia bacterium]|nr:hypothetical protein FACS1894132_09960 [Clostridia bacterium]